MKHPIKVLQFICPTGFYGAERWILALAKHLDTASIECDLAVTAERENQDLEVCSKYKELGLNVFEVPMRHKFDLSAIKKLAKVIQDNKIDIIHTHGYKSDIIGVMAARKAGIPCVVTPHGFENAKDFKLKLFIWLGCKVMRFADVVAPLSPQLVVDCQKIGVPENKIKYIQNGVDLSEVEKTVRPERDSELKRIGFVGQMISRKNIHDLLDIFNSLHIIHPDTILILLGDGDSRKELEEYASTLPCRDSIQFLGFRDDRLELLKSFDLFVMTSTLEGIPRCLMEAAAAEIPVAAYDIAGIDQLIKHNVTGLLAPLGDKDKLLHYWEELLYDKNKSETLSKAARQHVYEHYSAKRMADEYTDLFKQLSGNSLEVVK